MVRNMKRADLDAVADIWLDTNLKAHNFIPAQYWRSHFEAVKGMLRGPGRGLYRRYLCPGWSPVPGDRQNAAGPCKGPAKQPDPERVPEKQPGGKLLPARRLFPPERVRRRKHWRDGIFDGMGNIKCLQPYSEWDLRRFRPGIFYGDERDDEGLGWLEARSFTTAFVTGNHENCDALRKYPLKE